MKEEDIFNLTDEEVDVELRAAGIDPDIIVKKTKAVLKMCQRNFDLQKRINELENDKSTKSS